jgi:4-hydroxy-4-methyl-2-oxoglutarate aldolase
MAESPWQFAARTNVHPDYKVVVNIERPPTPLVERFKKVHFQALVRTAHLSHLQLMDLAIKPAGGHSYSICGPAVTVRLDYIDVLACAAATKVCRPGDVIVVSGNAYPNGSIWGGALSRGAKQQGCEGVVVDGTIGSLKMVVAADLPLFCRGVHPVVGTFDKPGSVNVPVVCGGVLVNPGDLVVGNEDGLAVVPRDYMEQAIEAVEASNENRRLSMTEEEASGRLFFDAFNGMELLHQAGVRWVED